MVGLKVSRCRIVRYDINTAPAELLEAAGVTHAMVQNIIEARRSRPFTSTEDAQRRVKSLGNVKTKLLESNGILFPLWNPGEDSSGAPEEILGRFLEELEALLLYFINKPWH